MGVVMGAWPPAKIDSAHEGRQYPPNVTIVTWIEVRYNQKCSKVTFYVRFLTKFA